MNWKKTMVRKMKTKSGIEYEQGSTNVFADLGRPDADELFARGLLAVQIFTILAQRKIKKQKDVAELLGIDKSEASKLLNTEFNRFSQERLIHFLNKLNYKVVMQISPMQKGDKPQEVLMV